MRLISAASWNGNLVSNVFKSPVRSKTSFFLCVIKNDHVFSTKKGHSWLYLYLSDIPTSLRREVTCWLPWKPSRSHQLCGVRLSMIQTTPHRSRILIKPSQMCQIKVKTLLFISGNNFLNSNFYISFIFLWFKHWENSCIFLEVIPCAV